MLQDTLSELITIVWECVWGYLLYVPYKLRMRHLLWEKTSTSHVPWHPFIILLDSIHNWKQVFFMKLDTSYRQLKPTSEMYTIPFRIHTSPTRGPCERIHRLPLHNFDTIPHFGLFQHVRTRRVTASSMRVQHCTPSGPLGYAKNRHSWVLFS